MLIAQVYQHPETITQLQHRLKFTNDRIVNEYLLTRYGLYTYLTPCEPDNTRILQATINEWSDYCNKLYDTTLYKYNPIENYDRTEESTDVTHGTSTAHSTADTDSTLKNSGYNSDALTVTQGTESGTVADSNGTSDGTLKRNSHIHGNIGTVSTQMMIEQERRIILDVLDFYISKFANCFNLDMEVSNYGFFR